MNNPKKYIEDHDNIPPEIKENPPTWLIDLIQFAYDKGGEDRSDQYEQEGW